MPTQATAPFAFEVTPHAQHQELPLSSPDYDEHIRTPKNIGAIWIEDSEGRLVRSLQVWANERLLDLAKYNRARDLADGKLDGKLSPKDVDATTSATVRGYMARHVTWDLKNRAGADVPAGKYTLVVEVADKDNHEGDNPGEWASVEFDTKQRPMLMNPEPTQYYTDMKLQIK